LSPKDQHRDKHRHHGAARPSGPSHALVVPVRCRRIRPAPRSAGAPRCHCGPR
jgi:hypothetical protein